MNITNLERSEVLTRALPYIQKYSGKTVVVKYGGNAMINKELEELVMGDLVLLAQVGIRVVLVHGGGPEINDLLQKVGKVSSFVDGLRVTDRETMDYVSMALAGKISKELVSLLQVKGGRALGISGVDGRLIKARQLDPRLGYVGQVEAVNAALLEDLLEKGYIPVVSSLGYDDQGAVYNINADTAAAYIAGALEAECLIAMTNTPGILRDPADPASLIREVDLKQAQELCDTGVVSGGMIPKVQCCMEAIRRGVKKVFILDGREKHAILEEILTDEGVGTMVRS